MDVLKRSVRNLLKNPSSELGVNGEPRGILLATIKHLDVARTVAMKLLNTNVSEWDEQQLRIATIVSSAVTIVWWIGLTVVAQRPIWFW